MLGRFGKHSHFEETMIENAGIPRAARESRGVGIYRIEKVHFPPPEVSEQPTKKGRRLPLATVGLDVATERLFLLYPSVTLSRTDSGEANLEFSDRFYRCSTQSCSDTQPSSVSFGASDKKMHLHT